MRATRNSFRRVLAWTGKPAPKSLSINFSSTAKPGEIGVDGNSAANVMNLAVATVRSDGTKTPVPEAIYTHEFGHVLLNERLRADTAFGSAQRAAMRAEEINSELFMLGDDFGLSPQEARSLRQARNALTAERRALAPQLKLLDRYVDRVRVFHEFYSDVVSVLDAQRGVAMNSAIRTTATTTSKRTVAHLRNFSWKHSVARTTAQVKKIPKKQSVYANTAPLRTLVWTTFTRRRNEPNARAEILAAVEDAVIRGIEHQMLAKRPTMSPRGLYNLIAPILLNDPRFTGPLPAQ